jgi:hypothetical protein
MEVRLSRRIRRKAPATASRHRVDLVGPAGECLVEAELLVRGINVARPRLDEKRIDLLPLAVTHDNLAVCPIQVKSASTTALKFKRSWFNTPNLVLVWVWYVTAKPRYFIFSSRRQVERFLRTGTRSATWLSNRQYNVSRPTRRLADLAEHENRWDRIVSKLRRSRRRR